jgi:hypothetical protein
MAIVFVAVASYAGGITLTNTDDRQNRGYVMKCVACGMPMVNETDHAMGDQNKDYCIHCCRPDGSMQSYEERKKTLVRFIVSYQGADEKQASALADSIMHELPAWSDHK